MRLEKQTPCTVNHPTSLIVKAVGGSRKNERGDDGVETVAGSFSGESQQDVDDKRQECHVGSPTLMTILLPLDPSTRLDFFTRPS